MSFEQAVLQLEQTNAILQQEVVRFRDAAMGLNNIYATQAEGLAATGDGKYFSVPGGGAYMRLYRRQGSSAELIAEFPDRDSVQAALDAITTHIAAANPHNQYELKSLLGSAAYRATAGAGSVYARGGILGAVSQSGGVPTGAIIERGSNSDGEYVKYADGSLVCTRTQVVSGVVINDNAPGELSRNAVGVSFPFPVLFALLSGVGGGKVNPRSGRTVTSVGVSGGTQWEVAYYRSSGSAIAFEDHIVYLTAHGRWF